MSENTRISVIVPAYNNAPWLPRCLDSLLEQSHTNLEIIVVDDGSQDDTAQILEKYATQDSRVRVIHKENGGVTAARLTGLTAAAGEWIGFVDGDDQVDPDMYQRLLKNADAYHADISHCGYRMVFADGRVNYFHNTGKIVQQDRDTGLSDLLSGTMIEPGLCNKLYRRELIENLLEDPSDLKNIRINEDLLMNFMLFKNAERSVFEDFCPYQYIVRDNSASRQKLNWHQVHDPILVKEKILKIAPESLHMQAETAYLSTCIDVYAAVVLSEKKNDYADVTKGIRAELRKRKAALSRMSTRRRILAKLIVAAPGLFCVLYKAYARHCQVNPYQ